MKKILSIVLALALVLSVCLGIAACNKNGTDGASGDKNLSKVAQALDGVERSMNKSGSLYASVGAEKKMYLSGQKSASIGVEKELRLWFDTMSTTDALGAIRGVYTSDDKQADTTADLDYNQPPMMQFRYLKAIFEEMGDDYALGTKYYYDITGQMYFDMETGYAVDATRADVASYRYDYVFGFAMSIELKENDLIFAEVAFNIGLTQGSNHYKTSWYVSFDLDYDFNSSEPTYTLTMLTDNKEADLVYLHRPQGYEYDYVDVKKGAITEWRKFGMDVDREITLGGKYASFENYIEEGVVYSADTAKWLKDGELYKVTQMNESKNRTLATAFVNGMGMNSTMIKSGEFLSKSGTKNTLIDTYYKKICQVYGGDIIYDLVCKDEDDGGHGGNGSQNGSGSWAGVVASLLPEGIPFFETTSASFAAEVTDEGILISVQNVGQDDYRHFGEALEGAGFTSQGNTYYKNVEDGVILVSVSPDHNAVFITKGANESKKTITIEYGIDFESADVGSVQTQAVNDIYQISEAIERDFADKLNVKAMSNVQVGSIFYDITLAYTSADELAAEKYAADKANEYGGKYIRNGWTNTYNNTVNVSVQDGKEVLVLISSSGAESDAHVYIYVLLYEVGTVSGIVDGPDNGGGAIGEGGDGNTGGEIGGGEDQPQMVFVMVCYLDEGKKVLRSDPLTLFSGQVVDLGGLLIEPGQRAYLDPSCERPIEDEVKASEGLTLYVWAEPKGQSEPQLYDITIYDVVNGVVSENPTIAQTILGETTYYGHSFTYVVYWDKDCTDLVDLDYNFTMTEDGITLYRDMTQDYVAVKTDYYLNGVLMEHREGFYRKGLIYSVINNVVIDFDLYTTAYDRASTFYLGEGNGGARISYGDRIAFTEETTITGYGTSREYRVYTVVAGGKELGQVVTDQPQYVTSYGEVFGKNDGGVNEAEGTITLTDTKSYKTYRNYIAWQGKTILNFETYFDEDMMFGEEGASAGAPSKTYFTDVTCRTPIVFDENGVYVIKSSTTLYTPLSV